MARYYSGDVEGKFWFAVQSSDVGERFGASTLEPNEIKYYIHIDDIDIVRDEIKSIKKALGLKLFLFKEFFIMNISYNDEMLKEYFKKEDSEFKYEDLSEYADLLFGEEVLAFMEKENESCYFDAEL